MTQTTEKVQGKSRYKFHQQIGGRGHYAEVALTVKRAADWQFAQSIDVPTEFIDALIRGLRTDQPMLIELTDFSYSHCDTQAVDVEMAANVALGKALDDLRLQEQRGRVDLGMWSGPAWKKLAEAAKKTECTCTRKPWFRAHQKYCPLDVK